MFFYISGIGASFYDTEKNHYGVFIGGKVLRILVPFVIAIFVFLIPRLYFGQQYEDYTRVDGEIQSNYWEYMKGTLPTIYLKLSWLWYLPALFIDFVICYPLLRWSVRRSKGIPFDGLVDTGIVLLQIATLALWATVNYYLVPTYNYNTLLLIPAICVLGAVFFCFYTLQLTINTRYGHHNAMLIKLIGPIGSVLLNLYKVQTKDMNLYHIFLMINYDAIFFSQGVVDQCYWRKMVQARKEWGNTVLAPVCVVFFLFMYSITSPMNYSNMGHLFFYPLYTDYWLQCLYTSGTWIWVYSIIWVMAWIANDKFNDTVFNYVTGSSMFAYLSHYFYILLISVLIVRPYKMQFVQACALMFFGCQLMIFLTYVPLNFLYELAFPPKATKKMDTTLDDQEAKQKSEEAAKAKAKADALEKGNDGALDLEADNESRESRRPNNLE
jgi:hypothetical protein